MEKGKSVKETFRLEEKDHNVLMEVDKVISYMLRLNNIRLVGGYGILLTNAKDISEQFHKVKYYYGKTGGKQIRHYVFSVEKSLHFSAFEIKELGYLLGLYFGNEHQVVFAVHELRVPAAF